MGEAAYQPDHESAALARRAHEFLSAANLESLIKVLVGEVQALEDAFVQVLVGRSIDGGEGKQLDTIGKVIGEPRGNSANDDEYRLRLRARIRVNRSHGHAEDILSVFRALIPVGPLLLTEDPVFGQTLDIGYQLTNVAVFAKFLQDAKARSVYSLLKWHVTDDAHTFTMGKATTLQGALTGGVPAATITVRTTKYLPASGTFLIDEGVPGIEELMTYTGKTGTTLTGCSTATNSHPVQAAIVANPANKTMGWGDTADVTIGGGFTGITSGLSGG